MIAFSFNSLFFPDQWLWPWAFGLLVIPLLLLWKNGRPRGGAAFVFSGVDILRQLGRPLRSRIGALRFLWPILGLAFLAVALARPQNLLEKTEHIHSGVDVMLVLDATPTMLAEDFTLHGRRISRVDAVIRLADEFIEARQNDRIGLIYFAAFPSLLSAPTHHHEWLRESLRRVEVRPATAIGDAIASAANRLKDSEAESRIIVLLTDGDNNWGRLEPATAAEAAGVLGIRIYAVGIGSDHPVPIPGYRGMAEAILDETTLRNVAENSDGKYFRAKSTDDLRKVFREIDQLEKTEFDAGAIRIPQENLHPWILAAAFCLLLGFLTDQGSWRRL